MRINSRLIWESLRIGEDHQESSRINENQFQTDLRINKNHQESISHLFENWWESVRIIENWWESLRINKNQWESLRIIENHIEIKVLPLQWSKAKWHRYMKINVFIVIRIDKNWFCDSTMNILRNSKLRPRPPDLADLVNLNYASYGRRPTSWVSSLTFEVNFHWILLMIILEILCESFMLL